ncbi:sensor histidine kinase [Oribacterium sp. P6A1]|uniref:sensor histidine kinase n=1 Tax=Oribacterium sp. P6A1 TaxID=1410612 RepID=UPI00068EF9C7|nr:HAMP domain-containing sensor histidine kinase [Oribacterium sp. P6A1]
MVKFFSKAIHHSIFQKSRVKIVASIMSMLTLVLILTLMIIYMTTLRSVYKSNQHILLDFTEQCIGGLSHDVWDAEDGKNGKAAEKEDINNGTHKESFDISRENQLFKESPSYTKVTVCYVVAFNAKGEVVEIWNDVKPLLSDEALTEMASVLLYSGNKEGSNRSFVYRITEYPGNWNAATTDASLNGDVETKDISDTDKIIYVAMMDNTLISDSISALLINTIITGTLALGVLFMISVFLADKIVKPLEDSYCKQRQFIADAGHELKTPISTISANADILKKELGENSWLDNIIFENRRMKDLVTQLLDLARTENTDVPMEDLDFSHLVTGSLLPFDTVIFDHGMVLESDIQEDIYIKGNPVQLEQLVSTLVDNAISHTKYSLLTEQPCIRVRLYSERGHAVLEVTNPGDPIPVEDREKIFERFYRSDQSRQLNGHYGLGLAIAKAVTERHHGKISVDSEAGYNTFSVVIAITV